MKKPTRKKRSAPERTRPIRNFSGSKKTSNEKTTKKSSANKNNSTRKETNTETNTIASEAIRTAYAVMEEFIEAGQGAASEWASVMGDTMSGTMGARTFEQGIENATNFWSSAFEAWIKTFQNMQNIFPMPNFPMPNSWDMGFQSSPTKESTCSNFNYDFVVSISSELPAEVSLHLERRFIGTLTNIELLPTETGVLSIRTVEVESKNDVVRVLLHVPTGQVPGEYRGKLSQSGSTLGTLTVLLRKNRH